MVSFDELLGQFSVGENLVNIKINDDFDFSCKDQTFLIKSGSMLCRGEKDSRTGVRATQTFGKHDPIGFSEAIAAREMKLEFKPLTDLVLVRFDAENLKKQVNDANIFAKTIIKYSLGRIFLLKRNANNFAFEDDFLARKDKISARVKFERDQVIFSAGSDSRNMYFIERGEIAIVSKGDKTVARLSGGECFGESALLSQRPRNFGAISKTDSILLMIEESVVDKEIRKEPPLVQLTILLLLKRLELMNKLRMV